MSNREILAVAIVVLGVFFAGFITHRLVDALQHHRAYTRAQQACLAYAREHVPDVDPVAWCEP